MRNRNKKWSHEDDKWLRILHGKAVLAEEIANILGRTADAVRMRACHIGVSKQQNPLTEKDMAVIDHGADQGWTSNDLVAAVGKLHTTIRAYLRRMGKKARKERVYSKDEEFFSRKTNVSAYAAGLIASDGHVSPGGNTITITLRASEGYVLEHLRKVTSYKGKVMYYRSSGYRYATLSFGSAKRWSNDLWRLYGIHNNKSHTMGPPSSEIRGDLAKAYLVGLFEGDGSMKNYNVFFLRISGSSKGLLSWVKDTLEELTGHECNWYMQQRLSVKTGRPNSPHYYVRLLGRKAAEACQMMMAVGVHRMKHKWQLAEAQIIRYDLARA